MNELSRLDIPETFSKEAIYKICVNLRKLLRAHKGHIRETSLFTEIHCEFTVIPLTIVIMNYMN